MQYKFKEGEENKPANERTIQKTGLVVEFDMIHMDQDDLKFEKVLKELRGNRQLKQGIVDNVAMHHPHVKDIPEIDRVAIHMYQEAFAMVRAYDTKIAETEADYEAHKAERAEIIAQLPDLAPVPSPYPPGEAGETKVEGEKNPE